MVSFSRGDTAGAGREVADPQAVAVEQRKSAKPPVTAGPTASPSRRPVGPSAAGRHQEGRRQRASISRGVAGEHRLRREPAAVAGGDPQAITLAGRAAAPSSKATVEVAQEEEAQQRTMNTALPRPFFTSSTPSEASAPAARPTPKTNTTGVTTMMKASSRNAAARSSRSRRAGAGRRHSGVRIRGTARSRGSAEPVTCHAGLRPLLSRGDAADK